MRSFLILFMKELHESGVPILYVFGGTLAFFILYM